MNLLVNKLVENWRKLIFEAEKQLNEFNCISDHTYEDKSVFDTWEQFLDNQKGSLENYINFLNHKNQEE